jgi:hypothetical protein
MKKTVAALSIGLITGAALPAGAQAPRFDYRVVFASLRQLERQIDSAARDGFACVAMARVDPGVATTGVAVVLGRPVGEAVPVTHLVVAAAGNGQTRSRAGRGAEASACAAWCSTRSRRPRAWLRS